MNHRDQGTTQNPYRRRSSDVAGASGIAEAGMALALFDEIECGLIVCDEHGRIQFANHAAQQELATRLVLQRSDGVLRVTASGVGELDAAMRHAATGGRRCLVRLIGASDELMVSVLPLQIAGDDARHVLIILGRRQPCSDLALELLASSYGLTLAERKVLGALIRQATPREIASAHAVKLCTVRTQILSIRAKFGSRSIEGLLLRAAQVPPVTGALRLAGRAAAEPSGGQAATQSEVRPDMRPDMRPGMRPEVRPEVRPDMQAA
ncbi:helix-turn-helix transcriptional regulator [Roseateles noduli]|uniref:helix-turn-helix transcriptional regulator n=1 Tax=Roseateles noduli TaxID=2052484 RepID=UPI003D651D4C